MEEDFDRLLRQGPPSLIRTPTVELPIMEPPELEEGDDDAGEACK